MRYLIRLAAAAALVVFVSGSPLRAQLSDTEQHLKDLARANSLDAKGAQPWHLRMTFQLNDLNGKPKESGTIEEWWVSPQSRRLEIRSASYNLTIPSDPSDSQTSRNRESYLVNELLDEVVHPIPEYGDFKNLAVTEAARNFGKVKLSCISVGQAGTEPRSKLAPSTGQFCFTPNSSALRGHLGEGQYAAVRNRIATFHGIELGLDNTLLYGTKNAITGHVDTLESFHPNSSIALTQQNTGPEPVIPGVVIAGRIVKKVTPAYPLLARRDHIAGSVILCATITKQGTISDMDVVSSPDRSLTESAMDAVKQWTYQPYLLNGSPTQIETTITVNYNLNGY